MDGPKQHDPLVAITCMMRSLTDQMNAFQRDQPMPAARAPDGVVAELLMLVLRVQRDVEDLRAEIRSGIRTSSVIVDDGIRQVVITPGEVVVERKADPDDPRSGSWVHIQSFVRGAEVTIEAANTGREFGVTATMNANWEGDHPIALLSAQTGTAAGDEQVRELRVDDDDWAATAVDAWSPDHLPVDSLPRL
ncbi:MAG: hypothetical protein ABW328_15715 [Ilumatobacteraceae bacterium]